MKVLIVEDTQKTAAYLRKGLGENGFVVDLASQGEEGLHLARTGEYDLIILDVMLPERDGWSVISELRRVGKQTPVLFLTARDAVQDRVKGLELGADDYLIKPFAFSELLARVRSILRRGPVRQLEMLRIADLELDLLRHKATRGVVIPRSAVVRFGGKAWAYVQTDEVRFSRREVALDQATEQGWFTTAGFTVGDRVVVAGAQLLLSEEFKSQIQIGEDRSR